MRKYFNFLSILALSRICACSPSAEDSGSRPAVMDRPQLGLFVNDASPGFFLYSGTATIDEMLALASEIRADVLFIHAYNDDRKYFDAGASTDPQYRNACAKAGTDLFGYLLDGAQKRGLKVFAWVNCFSLTKSAADRHPLLKLHGQSVLTRDQNGRAFDGLSGTEPADAYYMRDRLMWLEPGDLRVRNYLLEVFAQILGRYPSLEGLQLDFIRYPVDPPFVPGGRFVRWGYSPGYGGENLRRFQQRHGFSPSEAEIGLEMNPGWNGAQKALLWDRWRRAQVTSLVKEVRRISGKKALTASVFAYADRVYFTGFQDWRAWLENGLLDFAIPMNYTIDTDLAHHLARQQEGSFPGQIWPALGAYVMVKDPSLLEEQINILYSQRTEGFAVFDYSILHKNPVLRKILRERDGPDPAVHP